MQQQRGFTLLLAALIASIVLALGASIFSIAQKQITLSSIGRNSQFAFYVADTIAECALYWDFRFSYFSSSATSTEPSCDGHTLTFAGEVGPYPYTISTDRINIFMNADGVNGTGDDGGYCAEVTVTKSFDANIVSTLVHANGYSVSCDSISTSPQALQRSVELSY